MNDNKELIALVNAQADDEGLWFVAQTAPEAYLQAALRTLHTALEAADKQGEPVAWQPISTAPKDGTAILALLPYSDMCYVIEWADAENGIRKEAGEGVGWHIAWDGYFLNAPNDTPVKWMPIPDEDVTLYTHPQPDRKAIEDGWYLQDKRSFVGNDILWWAKGGNGYTTDIREAHVYTKEEAYRQARSRDTDVPWPKQYIDTKTRPTVDFQYLEYVEALKGSK